MYGLVPVLVDPHVSPMRPAFFVQVLQRTVQRRVVLASHEQATKGTREFRAETALAVLHEASHERRRYRRKLMLCKTPVAMLSVSVTSAEDMVLRTPR